MAAKIPSPDHKALAAWALDCAKQVLPYFESVSGDKRPCQAIAAGRQWVKTGIFSMKTIRQASLGAHAAARGIDIDQAKFAARAAGQAVATAHVPEHAYGALIYALEAVEASDPSTFAGQRQGMLSAMPKDLRVEFEKWSKRHSSFCRKVLE